jgi:CCR4-NOT transcription complex subunit 10
MEMTEFNFRLHLYKAKVRLLQVSAAEAVAVVAALLSMACDAPLEEHTPAVLATRAPSCNAPPLPPALASQGQVKASKKEIKSALEIFQRELRPNAEVGGGKGGADSDDEEAALPLSSSGSPQGGGDPSLPPPHVANVAALYLKANLEYLRLNYRKALKLLASCQKGEGAKSALYFSNMGCLHAKMGLHHVGLQYFQKALLCYEGKAGAAVGRGLEPDGRVLPPVLCEVTYNTGVQLLLLGRYPQAFRCFENAALLFYNRPRVWLRLAECCIQQHRVEQEARGAATKGRMVARLVGRGRHRRAVLDTASGATSEAAAAGGKGPGPEGAAAKGNGPSSGPGPGPGKANGEGLRGQCTLPYAVKCLQNALFLLAIASQGGGASRLPGGALLGSKLKEGAAAGGSQAEAEAEPAADNGPDAPPEQDEALLEQVALLQLSFVYLCLREPVLALQHAEQLLGRTGVAEPKLATAHQYAAEALCMLGRPEEGLRHLLSPDGQQPLAEEAVAQAVAGQRQRRSKEVTPSSYIPHEHFVAQAKSGLQLNLANVHLMLGNLPAAERCVRTGLTMCPSSTEAIRALVFVLLRKGSTAHALEVLKTRRPIGEG